jgi:L-alanine-DL-glutamate epimerase-like enolase superfamily enzyme
MYGSGGCCDSKEHFQQELAILARMGIDLYKIRAVKQDVYRTAWILDEAARHGIEVGVDMCQNLANPPQPVEDVAAYVENVYRLTDQRIVFLEEAIGPANPEGFKELRDRVEAKVCGGEVITTPVEMIERIDNDVYDFVQPDASVIGGITAVMDIFNAAAKRGTEVVVHAWGGPVAIMANYHTAFAGGGMLVEYPMLAFPLREAMVMDGQMHIEGGRLRCPTAPGIGIELTPQIEAQYAYDKSAVYDCTGGDWQARPDDDWK